MADAAKTISLSAARRSSTLRHTVVRGTCNAQQQSKSVLLSACGRDDGSRDDWIPLLAFGAAVGASALPAALLRLNKVSAAAEGAHPRCPSGTAPHPVAAAPQPAGHGQCRWLALGELFSALSWALCALLILFFM
ncbi:hypothetical protein HaLaN_15518, partial [Haematococcus lacustris]